MKNQTLKRMNGGVTAEESRFFGQGAEPQSVKVRLFEQMKPHGYVVEVKFESGKKGTCYYGFALTHAESVFNRYVA